MYAIIDDRGSQYKVREGDTLEIQLQTLPQDTEQIVFDRVLMLGEGESARVGQPYLADARVTASIKGEVKGDKITVIKMKRRKGYRRKQGHRQKYLQIHINKIEASIGDDHGESEAPVRRERTEHQESISGGSDDVTSDAKEGR